MKGTLNRESAVPLFEQISDQLREAIENAEFTAGDRLPTEGDLTNLYGVSRSTVRAALELLENEGAIARRSGKGTYVSLAEVHHETHELESFPETLQRRGLESDIQTLSAKKVVPAARVRGQLGIEPGGRVLQMERLHRVGTEAIALDRISLPLWLVEQVPLAQLKSASTYTVMEEHGIRIGPAMQIVSAIRSSERLAQSLDLNPGEPLLMVERLTYAIGGNPVEHAFLFWRGDRIALETTLFRHDARLVEVTPQTTVDVVN